MTMGLWDHGNLDQWNFVTMGIWEQGTLGPWDVETIGLLDHVTVEYEKEIQLRRL